MTISTLYILTWLFLIGERETLIQAWKPCTFLGMDILIVWTLKMGGVDCNLWPWMHFVPCVKRAAISWSLCLSLHVIVDELGKRLWKQECHMLSVLPWRLLCWMPQPWPLHAPSTLLSQSAILSATPLTLESRRHPLARAITPASQLLGGRRKIPVAAGGCWA